MTVIQLECFLETVKQRNFSRAAANLYMSQPTLSRHIKSLEDEFRVQLFIRANNTVRLTALGETIYPMLDKLYQTIRDATAEIHEVVDRQNSLLRVGISAGLSLVEPLRKTLVELQKQAPNTHIQLCHLTTSQIYNALMDGEIDLLYALEPTVPPSDKLRRIQLESDQMCLAVPSYHVNAGLPYIADDDTAIKSYFPDLPFCVLDNEKFDQNVHNELDSDVLGYDSLIGATGMKGKFAEMDALMMMVDAGLGVTIVNQNCIQHQNNHVRMIPLVKITANGIEYQMANLTVFWIEKSMNPSIRVFLKILKSIQREPPVISKQ